MIFNLRIHEFIVVFTIALIAFVPKRLTEPERSAAKGRFQLTVQTVKRQLELQLATTPKPGEIAHHLRSERLPGTSLAQPDTIVSKTGRNAEREDDTIHGG